MILLIRPVGLGLSKGSFSSANISFSSLRAPSVCPTSSYVQIVRGTIPSWTSFKYLFNCGAPLPFFPKKTLFSSIHFFIVSLLVAQHLHFVGKYSLPVVGLIIG